MIEFDCNKSQHEEAVQYPSHPCWGWFKTHTYEFVEPITITHIAGDINTGPSESSTFFPVEIQLSMDKITWISVGETGAIGNEGYAPFSVNVNNIKAKYLRFYALAGYVDGSKGTITYGEEPPPIPPPIPRPIDWRIIAGLGIAIAAIGGYVIYKKRKK